MRYVSARFPNGRKEFDYLVPDDWPVHEGTVLTVPHPHGEGTINVTVTKLDPIPQEGFYYKTALRIAEPEAGPDFVKLIAVAGVFNTDGPTALSPGKLYMGVEKDGGYEVTNDLGGTSWYAPERFARVS